MSDFNDKGNKAGEDVAKNEIQGLFPVTETDAPTTGDIVITGFHIDENHTQVWDYREKTSDELAEETKAQAHSQLIASDLVAIRCIKAGIVFPDVWKEYIVNLRKVISGELNELPVQPEYPEGS